MEKYSELLQALLKNRGITDEKKADIFLNPDYGRDLHDPFLLRDMEKACVRIFEAIEAKEKIVIYADYDCDGIPGAVILCDLFKKLGLKVPGFSQVLDTCEVGVYIPDRHAEGYGLNMDAIKKFEEEKVNLIITVDLGTTAVAEVAQAEANGIDVIITDHHLPHGDLPKAFAILNHKVKDAGYPEQVLSGAGMAFKLVQGFLKKYGEYFKIADGQEKWLLDMAGIATLSDMVPLTGENRAITYFGMKVLRRSPRPGIRKLLSILKINQNYLTEDDIGFMLAPRINAASRMGDPMKAFDLLSADNETDAGTLAQHLSDINDDRKLMVANIMKDVNKRLEKRELREVIVVGDPSWRAGVLGLVAGKICEAYKKPAFVWGKEGSDIIKGSCRSDGSVNMVEIMTVIKESLIEFGGHEMAGGISILNERVHFLEDILVEAYKNMEKKENKKESFPARIACASMAGGFDMKMDLDDVNIKNWREIDKMSPFGLCNEKPVFLFEGVKPEFIKQFGKKFEHLEITFLSSENKKVKAISFFTLPDSYTNPPAIGKPINLYASFDMSRFMGREELRLRIVDIL